MVWVIGGMCPAPRITVLRTTSELPPSVPTFVSKLVNLMTLRATGCRSAS
jgi:hypothetical protein